MNELNSNLYSRSLDECYVPEIEQQRAWSTCGGTANRDDSVGLSGHCLGLKNNIQYSAQNHGVAGGTMDTNRAVVVCDITGANEAAKNLNFSSQGFKPLEGATMDSGLQMRMNNFYSQIIGVEAAGAAARTYTLEIKAPLSGGLFNDLWGASGLARSCPRLRQALGLVHINSGQVVLQFKNLFQRLIRRYGRPHNSGAANLLVGAVSHFAKDDVKVELHSDAPLLRLLYIRLPSFRTTIGCLANHSTRNQTGNRNASCW